MSNKKIKYSKSKSIRISNDHKKKISIIAVEKKQFQQAVVELAVDKLYEETFSNIKL